ncbi:hypothetical protein L7F22_017548 [Adiantum nelumboides]|nr:hypothetical protein [Adiantum nelumboides]
MAGARSETSSFYSKSSCSSYSSGTEEEEEEEEEDERLECPVCWEGFNASARLPYVLWCGHSLCKNCLLGLDWATVKLPMAPLQLPLLIACPWCQSLSCRLVWPATGKHIHIKYPRPNYFLLWLLESVGSADRPSARRRRLPHRHRQAAAIMIKPSAAEADSDYAPSLCSSFINPVPISQPDSAPLEELSLSRWFRRFGGFMVAKTLLLLLLGAFIVFCALPFSALVLVIHFLAALFFAFPAFLVVYFAFPCLGWLLKEIVK